MKIDRVKSDLSIVAGILFVLLISIFLGFALVGGFLTNPDNIKPPITVEYKKLQVDIAGTEPNLSGNKSIVSVAQKGCCCMDTEQGEIIIDGYNLPDVLPLCITQELLNTYYLTVYVTGGYEPIDGSITLYQKCEEVGVIDVIWTNADPEVTSCLEVWTANFVLTDGPIILDSNQWPAGADPLVDNPTIPGKCVCVVWDSLWQGCTDEEQQFELIQIHQHVSNIVPNSP